MAARDQAQMLVIQGDEFSVRGDLVRAIAAYSEAISFFPHAVAFKCRAAQLIKRGDFARAIADCTEAIRLDPEYYPPSPASRRPILQRQH